MGKYQNHISQYTNLSLLATFLFQFSGSLSPFLDCLGEQGRTRLSICLFYTTNTRNHNNPRADLCAVTADAILNAELIGWNGDCHV